MMATKHPCAGFGLSKRQREIFEQIATGDPHPPATLKQLDGLEATGLIKKGLAKLCRDGLGAYNIPQYYVPTPEHMQFCKWASEQARK